MGRNLPSDIRVFTTYIAIWEPYLAVLSDGDRQLVEAVFTRLRLKPAPIIDAGHPSPFKLSTNFSLAEVLNHAIRSKGDAATKKETGPYRAGVSGRNRVRGKVQSTRRKGA